MEHLFAALAALVAERDHLKLRLEFTEAKLTRTEELHDEVVSDYYRMLDRALEAEAGKAEVATRLRGLECIAFTAIPEGADCVVIG